jgi:hypothetical protein
MKYFNKSEYKFSDTPFPAYRCELAFGRNKRDFSFIPCNAHTEEGILFDDTFKVIKTKAKGTIMIVDGKETTNRALCFVSADAGFRGSVSIKAEHLCRILSSCHAGNACEETAAAAVVLDVDGYIDFHSTGRRHNYVYRYEFTGEDLVKTSYQKEEYDVLVADAEEAEEI